MLAGLLLTPVASEASGCTLVRVSQKDAATLKVYFTRFAREDKSAGKYKNCRIVKNPTEGSKTFVVTPFRQDANVVLLRSSWPKS